MKEKPTLASFQTSRGARIDRIPLEAFPGFWAYVYLVRTDGYCVLIDTGSGTDTSHEYLLSGLHQVGCQAPALTHILLTHAHIDHYGGLAKLHPLTRAKVGVHELDLQTVAHHEARLAVTIRRLDSFLAGTGLSEDRREQALAVYRLTKSLYRSIPVDFTYEAVDRRLGRFELIHLPGHCPGHVAIRLDDVIFCGDMVVDGVTPHLTPESVTSYSGLEHYLQSLARFQGWSAGARLVLNGHDEAISNLPAQIQATRQNILRRLSRAVDALAHPLNVDDVCRSVYGETSGYNQLLVIEKAGAYVEYLYDYGMIGVTNPEEVEQGQPAQYQRLWDEEALYAQLERRLGAYAGAPVKT